MDSSIGRMGAMDPSNRAATILITAIVVVTLVCLTQLLAWRPSSQRWLHHTPSGQWILSILPWQNNGQMRQISTDYGRWTARQPFNAALIGLVVAAAGACGVLAWPRFEPALSFVSPWPHLDGRTPLARYTRRTRAAFGGQSTLSVLALSCDPSAPSILDGRLLHPRA